MKIKIIIPITTKALELEAINEIRNLDTQAEIDVECIEYGTASIESMYDESLCAPGNY